MLYEELLDNYGEHFKSFFKNVPIFQNQFTWEPLNQQCYDCMYTNNSCSKIASVKDLKERIPGLKELCRQCADFYIPARNKSIPKYDIILGKQHEEVLMDFL